MILHLGTEVQKVSKMEPFANVKFLKRQAFLGGQLWTITNNNANGEGGIPGFALEPKFARDKFP